MVAKKTSEESSGTTPDGSEYLRAVQGGGNVKFLFSAIADYVNSIVRGVAAGGTGATSASGARANLGVLEYDTDPALTANSDARYSSQKAVKSYIDTVVSGGAVDVMLFKGVIDCSANPNYPVADAGHLYKVSVAGKIGGGSGPNVEVGDTLYCIADSTASGNHATVGAQWVIAQANVDGAVTGPASATSDGVAVFDGTSGKILKTATASAVRTTLAAAAAAQTEEMISGYIGTVADKTYKLVVKAAHSGTITEATTISESGTCTATWKINTTALGGTANSVSTSETSQAHSSANTFAAGDDIQLTVSANSTCSGLSFTLKYTRALA